MAEPANAHGLVSAARDLIRRDDAAAAGLWPRAAALLARQAIELALARLWASTAPGLERTSARCQLLCAGTMLNDRELGGRVGAAWTLLSGACHHGVYELPPTASELNGALQTVWQLADATERLHARINDLAP